MANPNAVLKYSQPFLDDVRETETRSEVVLVPGTPPRPSGRYGVTPGEAGGELRFADPQNPGNAEIRTWTRTSVKRTGEIVDLGDVTRIRAKLGPFAIAISADTSITPPVTGQEKDDSGSWATFGFRKGDKIVGPTFFRRGPVEKLTEMALSAYGKARQRYRTRNGII